MTRSDLDALALTIIRATAFATRFEALDRMTPTSVSIQQPDGTYAAKLIDRSWIEKDASEVARRAVAAWERREVR